MKDFAAKISYWKLATSVVLSWYFISQTSGGLAQDMTRWNLIDSVDLIIHEAGHFIFIFFGEFIQIFGGSFLQVAIPIVFAGYFFLRREHYSGSVLLFWVGQSIQNVAIYAGDAVVQRLPLLGGDGVIHDWNYLLTSLGLLRYTGAIAAAMYGLGTFVIITAAVLCFVFSVRKTVNQESKP